MSGTTIGQFYYDRDTRGGKHRFTVEGPGISGSIYLSPTYTGKIPDQIVLKKFVPGEPFSEELPNE